MTASFTLETEGLTETIAIQSSMDDLVDQINLQVQGVTASKDGNKLVISNDTGNQMVFASNSHLVGITAGTYEGMYTLENIDGTATKIELGNLANGYVQDTDATTTALNLFGLNESHSAGTTKGYAVTTDTLALTDDIRINGIEVGATTVDTAQAKADAINAISDQSGVTATASTTVFLDFDFTQSQTDASFKINGIAVAAANKDSIEDMVTEINTNTGLSNVVASATNEGLLKLFDSAGGNVTIAMTAITAFTTAYSDGDNIDGGTPGASTVFRGQIVLTSEDGSAIQLTDSSATNAGLAKLGLEGQSAEVDSGTAGVNVSTLKGATSALESIDKAIDTLSTFRASFGAVENRIDAKINNLTTLKVNTQAAQSRIEDADFAAETTNMTKAQILSQAATSMLAQANASKQNLLALLQG